MKQAVLLALPAVCAVLFLLPKPRTALRNYLLLFPFLPEFLVIKAGVSITGSRIASLIFLVAMLLRATGSLLPRLNKMDVVLLLFLASYLVAIVPGPPEGGAVFAAGFLMDILLPYYFLRCLIRTTDDVKELMRALIIPTYVVVVLAVFQSVTGYGIFDQFKTGADVFGVYDSGMKRLGLTRADVGLTHYIMLGLWFASQIPMAIGHYAGLGMDFGRILVRVLHYPIGAFCSLSGGSFLVTGVGVGSWGLLPVRKIWFVLAAVGLLGVVYIEAFSNRGTMAILATFAATDGDSAWYRIRLPAAVFAKMEGHWWSGFGRDKPNMGTYNDITNHYLWWLMQAGLPCMMLFVLCILTAFNRLYRAAQITIGKYLESLSWGIGAGILGIALGMLTVTLFGQVRTYMFVFFSMAACVHAAAIDERAKAVASLAALCPKPEPEPVPVA